MIRALPLLLPLVLTPPGAPQLGVRTPDAWAVLWVDGAEVGFTPVELDVAPGRHELALRSEYFQPWRGWVEVPPDARVTVDVSLRYKPVRVRIPDGLPAAEIRVNRRRGRATDGAVELEGLGTFEVLVLDAGRPVGSSVVEVCLEVGCALPGSEVTLGLDAETPRPGG